MRAFGFSAMALGLVALVPGCGGSGDGCTVHLQPGATPDATTNAAQTAFTTAKPGNVICFAAGNYAMTQELDLVTANVEIRGPTTGAAVLDFTGQVGGANGILVTGDGVKMSNFTVKNTKGDGIRFNNVTGVTVTGVTVKWDTPAATTNGGYGFYPVTSHKVLIEKSVAIGASDTGIYVGQSSQVIVRDNEVYGNVAGIEIENTTDAEVYRNNSHDNAAGILIFNLPDLPVKDGKRAKVHDNIIRNNNGVNFAVPGGHLSYVPSGTGMFVAASDNNELSNNTVDGNHSFGIGIFSYLLLAQLGGPESHDATYDPYPESNYIHDNTFSNNGTAPADVAASLAGLLGVSQLGDILWDGIADAGKTGNVKNCFNANGTATYMNFDAGNNFAGKTTDLGANACTGATLPAVSF